MLVNFCCAAIGPRGGGRYIPKSGLRVSELIFSLPFGLTCGSRSTVLAPQGGAAFGAAALPVR